MRHLIWLLVSLIVVVGGAYGILRWWQRVNQIDPSYLQQVKDVIKSKATKTT